MYYINGFILKTYNFLISRRFININNKICRRIRAILFHNICYECKAYMGKNNPQRIFYVIRCPQENMGLFAAINYVVYHLKYADEKKYEPVIDWQYYPNKYYSEDETVGKINVWEKFFLQPAGISVNEVYKSRNVFLSSGDWDSSALNELNDKERLLDSHNIYNKYIRLNAKMRDRVENEKKRIGFADNRILAVKIRGTDFVTSKPEDHSKVLGVADTIELINKKTIEWGEFDRIYLATEDTDILNHMVEYYGDKLFYTDSNTYKASDVGKTWLSELYDNGTIDKIEDMSAYLVTTYMLAEAVYIIAPAVGGTLGALRIKGDYDHFCVARYE